MLRPRQDAGEGRDEKEPRSAGGLGGLGSQREGKEGEGRGAGLAMQIPVTATLLGPGVGPSTQALLPTPTSSLPPMGSFRGGPPHTRAPSPPTWAISGQN